MKKITTTIMLVVISIISSPTFADKVTVNGKTYQCQNSCEVNTGPPTTISDCCGGSIAELLRPGTVITIGE
jgi:hypothetical protein